MNTQFEKFVTPMKEINELTARNFETVADLQLKTAEENVKIGMEQVKNATTITDADGWKSFFEAQADISKQVNDRFVANARTVVEMGNAYTAEVQRIVKGVFAV